MSRLGTAYSQGLQEAGGIATGKHFPGHGDTETDSHLALPIINVPRERLDSVELAPFQAPVLVLAAERDGLFPADKVIQRAREGIPNLVAAEVFPGATHYLPARYHPQLSERCECFLRETR